MKITPNKSFISTTAIVGASTAILPNVGGYGTQLFQIVVLGAWAFVASLTSGANADLNHGVVWAVAFAINVLLFMVPAAAVWLVCRKRWPVLCAAILVAWCLLYLSSLFFLFPATDGP